MVIVIAVIAILAAVLIPTFGNVIEKANKSAALQAAKNEYTEYLSEFDYKTGTPITDMIIVVDSKYYVEVTGGKVSTEVNDYVASGEGATAVGAQISEAYETTADAYVLYNKPSA